MNGNIWNDSYFFNSLVSLCDMGLKGTEKRNRVCKNAKDHEGERMGRKVFHPPSLTRATSFLFPSCCTGQDSLCFPLEHHWTAKLCKQLTHSCFIWILRRHIDGILTCYEKIYKSVNVDQPKTDVFSQGDRYCFLFIDINLFGITSQII